MPSPSKGFRQERVPLAIIGVEAARVPVRDVEEGLHHVVVARRRERVGDVPLDSGGDVISELLVEQAHLHDAAIRQVVLDAEVEVLAVDRLQVRVAAGDLRRARAVRRVDRGGRRVLVEARTRDASGVGQARLDLLGEPVPELHAREGVDVADRAVVEGRIAELVEHECAVVRVGGFHADAGEQPPSTPLPAVLDIARVDVLLIVDEAAHVEHRRRVLGDGPVLEQLAEAEQLDLRAVAVVVVVVPDRRERDRGEIDRR